MNCDGVFAILTRGPFPTGSRHDGAVERHLQICPDCQRLAEALRPNSELTPESIGIEESRVLPGYWGDSLPIPSNLAVSLSERGTAQENRRRRWLLPTSPLFRSPGLNVWQFAAALGLGIVVAAAFRTLVAGNSGPPPAIGVERRTDSGDASFITPSARQKIGIERRDQNDAANFPTFCTEGYSATPIVQVGFDDPSLPSAGAVSEPREAICCTQCHHAGSQVRLSDRAVVRFQASCRNCHN